MVNYHVQSRCYVAHSECIIMRMRCVCAVYVLRVYCVTLRVFAQHYAMREAVIATSQECTLYTNFKYFFFGFSFNTLVSIIP